MRVEHNRAACGSSLEDDLPSITKTPSMVSGLSVLQIVPRLGSQLDGVADYARTLGAALRSADADVRFLCGDPCDEGTDEICSSRLEKRSSNELASTLKKIASLREDGESKAVLIHYVNYGYATRGCPFWLIDGLRDWKRHQPRVRLVTMFHELYASGPPWRSSFWLSPLQRHLARELYSISDASVTNREQSRQWLCRGRADTGPRISVMPVFSSLGEPEKVIDWGGRSAQMVVAGRTGTTGRAYGRHRDQLVEACRALDIDEIVDIGARSDPVSSRIGDIRVSALGHLAPAQARAVLAKARAGFLDYPSDYLGKSTVFAAYAAHGLVPVVSWRRGVEETGLKEGANYWVPFLGDRTPRDFEAIAKRATAWYAGHRLDIQAREYAKLLRGDST
jgi:hypothetical protein